MTTPEEFSELVGDIYDAALDPKLWEQTLKRIATAAGGKDTGFLSLDRCRGHLRHLNCSLGRGATRKYEEHYWRLDPVASTRQRAPIGEIVIQRAIVTKEFLRGEFYNDWLHPNEIGDPIFVNILNSPDGVCTFAIGHPWRPEPFATPDMVRLVQLLVPHLQRAVQAQLGFGPLSLIRDGALDMVEHWRHGCVLVSFSGQVLYANRAANEIAAARDGLSLGCRGLHAAVGLEDAALQHLIRQACAGIGQEPRSGGRLAISRGSGCKPYTIQVIPLRSRHTNFLNGPAAALVLIVDPERATHLPPEDLQRLYDLTPAEAEAAIRVVRGHGLQSVADELRVSLSMVRVHLQRVFEKTGTHRQAELVRMLIELATTNMPDSLERTADTRNR